jgi:hypothetical protein
MARNPSIYTGLQQGAATKRNRHLRAARRYVDLLAAGVSLASARSLAEWEFHIEGSFLMSDDALLSLVLDLLRKGASFAVERARYWHREWRYYARLNSEWRAEMKAIDLKYGSAR